MALLATLSPQARGGDGYLYHDSHVHLTNYVQEGTEIHEYLEIMGDKVGRSTLFGLPLQQKWSYLNTEDNAPTYYLHSDAELYYYSFTDAVIAEQYNSLSESEKERFDPMITGFNPTDMYAVDHIKRVMKMYPGVFVGIGEFSVHKEFVSAKIAGETATLNNRALDRIFGFAAASGLIVLFHNDIDVPFSHEGTLPAYAKQMHELIMEHRETTVIWAHTGLGRIVYPRRGEDNEDGVGHNPSHLDLVEMTLKDSRLVNLHFDISWDAVAKYILATPESTKRAADLINTYPDRFLFGTDAVAPDIETYYDVYTLYKPLWDALTPEANRMIKIENYERIFDGAKKKVAAWEEKNGE
ncbi:amidohydrolase [bacterium]|nr:MAG: amidohydrolase [bacterium]